MAMVTSSFAPLLTPGLRREFFQFLKEQPLMYKTLFRVDKSKKSYEEDFVMAGLGTVPVKGEGVGTAYQDPVRGGVKRFTHVSYGLGFRVTREMKDDDQYGPSKRMNESLGRSFRNRINTDTFDPYNNGFSGTTHTTADGVVLFSTSHTLTRTGATQANRPSTDADLSSTTLQAALETFYNIQTEEGFYAQLKPECLLIPTSSIWIAKELLESELNPSNANNAINTLLGEGIRWKTSPFLSDSDAWFLQTLGRDNPLTWLQRTGIEYDSSDDFDSGDTKVKGYMRYSYGATIPQGIYGTSGG